MEGSIETETPQTFQTIWKERTDATSPLCIGIDPSLAILDHWRLPLDSTGAREFCLRMLDAAERRVAVVKPQVAFFEAFGPAGLQTLAEVIVEAQSRALLVIADAKRGDIGSTVNAYSQAWLSSEREAFNADAVTATAYLGFGSLLPLFERAAETGKAVFVVAHSSNLDGQALQAARMRRGSVAENLADDIASYNEQAAGGGVIGPIGAVIGATCGSAARNSINTLSNALFLVPGLGAQGASVCDIVNLFAEASPRVIPSVSRAIAYAGPAQSALHAQVGEFIAAMHPLREPSAING